MTFRLIVEFILALGFIIFIHEFGHFIVCKLAKVEVEEFGFGYPPKMVKLFRVGETDITLNWIPFGGFVRPKGENNPEIEGGLAAANPWIRISMALGGPMMNLILGLILFAVLFNITGAPDFDTISINQVFPDTPAEDAGLMAGDILYKIEGQRIDDMAKVKPIIGPRAGIPTSVIVERDGELMEFTIMPMLAENSETAIIGIEMTNPTVEISFLQALPMAGLVTYEQSRMILALPGMLIRKQIAPEDARILGPVGIFTVYEHMREEDIAIQETQESEEAPVNTLGLLGTLSIAFFLTNLLPLPALDGGRIILALPEALIKRRVPVKYENWINFLGFAFLLVLMFYITAQDIFNPVVFP